MEAVPMILGQPPLDHHLPDIITQRFGPAVK
jgi:hypothetical protein